MFALFFVDVSGVSKLDDAFFFFFISLSLAVLLEVIYMYYFILV